MALVVLISGLAKDDQGPRTYLDCVICCRSHAWARRKLGPGEIVKKCLLLGLIFPPPPADQRSHYQHHGTHRIWRKATSKNYVYPINAQAKSSTNAESGLPRWRLEGRSEMREQVKRVFAPMIASYSGPNRVSGGKRITNRKVEKRTSTWSNTAERKSIS